MRIFLDAIGCRLNQSEIERMGEQFRSAGHTLVESPNAADLVVVNTCAVTREAASDSRQKIRQAHRAGVAEIVATGCWVTIDPQEAGALPGVTSVVLNSEKSRLVPQLLGLPEEIFDSEPLERQPLPGLHLRTRAFIKAQDGCDNHCTYCVTRVARGAGRSETVETVLKDVRAALAGGTKEMVLTGVHLGSWGQDLIPQQNLPHLINTILRETNVPRLRLSSLEPWDLDEGFFTLWKNSTLDDPLFNSRICRHLHLPLQSGSGRILQRMARKITPHSFSHLVSLARSASPEIAITTDIMVGFPGETQEDFEESLAFVREINFAGGHVFSYSPRPGTPAASYPNQITVPEKKERSARMRTVLAEAALNYQKRYVGQILQVLWEAGDSFGPQGWRLQGLTDNYLKVTAYSPQPLWNEFSRVEIVESEKDGLVGNITTNL